MLITAANLTLLAQGFNAAFKLGFDGDATPPTYPLIAQTINSQTDGENYGWLKQMPGIREWVGPRVYHNLETTTAFLKNKTWEHTFAVNRDHIEDDRLGMYAPALSAQGELFRRHPDQLVWGLLANGFTTQGFDGQNYFDSDHLGYARGTGAETSWSNTGGGSGAPWFLADLSRSFMKPLIFQLRKPPEFTPRDRLDDPRVFDNNEFAFGASARYNAGFGFHQLCYGSKQTLDATAYEAARLALASQFRPDGSPLGVRATHLIVGPSNEARARTILEKEKLSGGEDNIWRGSAQLVVSEWLE